MRKIKRITSIILATLMVMSVFIAVPMTASALTEDDINSLLSSMQAMIEDYVEQGDWDHALPLSSYHSALTVAFEEANLQVTPEVESAYNAAYAYFYGGSGGFNGNYPNVNNVYMATDEVVEVTVSDLQPGDVLVTSSYPLEVQKGECDIVLVGGTYGEGDALEGILHETYTDDVTLGNGIIFDFMENKARINDMDNNGHYDAVYNNALGNAYMVLGNDNGIVYLAGYNFTTYTITWKDYNGSNLHDGQSTVAAGTVPYYRWSVSRDSTAQYSYTFTGWTDSSNNFYSKDSDLPAVTQDETYTATYSQTLRSYTITWKDGDNKTLKSESVAYGTTPSYTGATPTKTEDDDYTYEFNNTWSPSVASVTGNVTYTAQFTATPKHTVHTYTANPTFNWTQDASTGDWNCNQLTLTCTGCDLTQDYDVAGFFGASAVTCTANTDGSFTYSVSKTVDGTKYEDSKTYDADGVVKSATQLKAAAKKGGSWELGADLTGVTDVQCANGFVLDGKNHTVTRHANVSTQAVFRTTANPAEITLKNLTIDGIAGQSDSKPAIATKQSNPSAGNVINLENVTITNYDFDAANNGVVLAWGQATVNMKNCTVDTDSTYDVWGGAASTINVDGGEVGTVYLNGGTASAALTNGAVVDSFATSADNKIKDNGDGTYSVVPRVYVAQVGSTKYESLAEAITAAQDGGTVKLLADQTIDLQLAAGEEYTIDLNSYTLTVESPQNYYNYIYGNLTIDDSSAAKTGKVVVDDYGIAPRAGGKVTVNSGSFTTADGYPYLIYLMGGELEVNGGTFTAVHPVNCYASGKTVLGGTVVINDGEFTSTEDYVISGFENSNITINGGSFTGPNPVFVGKASKKTSGFTPASATINAGTFTATNDTPVVGCAKGASVVIKGGTFTDGELSADSTSELSVSGGTFDSAVPEEYCANGFVPKDNGNGTYGVGPDTSSPLNPLMVSASDINDGNAFGINSDYLNGTLLGVQKKNAIDDAEITSESHQENGSDMRFVAVLDKDLLEGADDYGFVLGKVDGSRTYEDTNINKLVDGAATGIKKISAKGTYNTVCGTEYGDPDSDTPYKYITCAVNSVDTSSKIVARFYYEKDGKTYFAKYAGQDYKYTGCMAGISAAGSIY